MYLKQILASKIQLRALTILGVMLCGGILTQLPASAESPPLNQCLCFPGATSDQGCNYAGCPLGTRRRCTCYHASSGGGCAEPVFPLNLAGLWSCTCDPDPVCANDPGGDGGGNPPTPGCTPTAPGPVTLNRPANNSVRHDPNEVSLRWTYSGGWGEGCPTVAEARVRIQENCTGSFTLFTSTTTNRATLSGLKWNTTYCWQVVRRNGSNLRSRSATWQFRTARKPIITVAIDPASVRCSGSTSSGRASFSSTNNPVKFNITIDDERNDFAGGLRYQQNLAFSFLNTAASPLDYANTNTQLHDPVGQRRFGFRVALLDNPTQNYRTVVNSAGAWGRTSSQLVGTNSGSLTTPSGIATLLDINVAGRTDVVDLNNTTMRASMVIRFEDIYRTTDLTMHVATLDRTESFSYVQNDYEYKGAWGADMTPPATSITDIRALATDRFQMRWNASDAQGLRTLRSYCYTITGSPFTIRDTALATNINLPVTPRAYPDPDNCLVNSAGRLGLRQYSAPSGTFTEDISFTLTAFDNSCNQSDTISVFIPADPWVLTSGGNVSAAGGFSGFRIRPVDPVLLNAISATLNNDAYLTSYLAIAGNNSLPPDRESAHQFYTRNYEDYQLKPQDITGQINWFDLLYSEVQSQFGVVNTGATNIAGNFNAAYGVAANSRRYVRHTGNLTVAAGAVCNIKGIIFVEGALTINPDLTNTSNNGCVFVARGNITIAAGGYKSNGVPQTNPALYDRVYGFFVTDGIFRSTIDHPGPPQVGDGLYIKGSVVADQVEMRRDLGLSHNGIQPAEIIEQDDFYLLTFQEELSQRTFSLRIR